MEKDCFLILNSAYPFLSFFSLFPLYFPNRLVLWCINLSIVILNGTVNGCNDTLRDYDDQVFSSELNQKLQTHFSDSEFNNTFLLFLSIFLLVKWMINSIDAYSKFMLYQRHLPFQLGSKCIQRMGFVKIQVYHVTKRLENCNFFHWNRHTQTIQMLYPPLIFKLTVHTLKTCLGYYTVKKVSLFNLKK